MLEGDEIVVAVEVPRFSDGARWSYRKSCRKPGELADAIAGVWVDADRGVARAVIGGGDAMPHVIDGVEALRTLREAASLARALDEAGLEDDYEREVHAAMLRRALDEVLSA